MRKITIPLLFLTATVLFISSCKKDREENLNSSAPGYSNDRTAGMNRTGTGPGDSTECPPTEVTLIAGQTINSGTVSVSNDSNYIYVTYSTANGYTLTQTHLYVGGCAGIPVNAPGNPIPGQFPYSGTHSNITSYTYQVPISVMGTSGCGCVAAHAVVQKLGASGNVIDQQTGWGNGVRINLSGGNWGMKFNYCLCQ